MTLFDKIAPFWKAVVAFITPGLVALGVAMQVGSPADATVTPPEWVGIVIAMFVTAGVVYAVPNKRSAAAKVKAARVAD